MVRLWCGSSHTTRRCSAARPCAVCHGTTLRHPHRTAVHSRGSPCGGRGPFATCRVAHVDIQEAHNIYIPVAAAAKAAPLGATAARQLRCQHTCASHLSVSCVLRSCNVTGAMTEQYTIAIPFSMRAWFAGQCSMQREMVRTCRMRCGGGDSARFTLWYISIVCC